MMDILISLYKKKEGQRGPAEKPSEKRLSQPYISTTQK
jgi:hypothetical protein